MDNHHNDRSLDREEQTVRELLKHDMSAAVERLREDADHFPQFNQLAKDLYYEKTPPVGATVILEPIINRHGPTGEKRVEVWNQHVFDGKSVTVTVAIMDERGNHHAVRR